jgi:hypothetical protein
VTPGCDGLQLTYLPVRFSAAGAAVCVAAASPRAECVPRPPDAPFVETASQRFQVIVDGREHDHRVLPSLSPEWKGRIENFRLDFPDDEPGIRYEVRELEFVP